MSPKQPSKQKRAAQNRNQRAARAARAANANAAPRSTSASTSATGGGSLLSRLRGGGSRATAASSARARGAAMRPDQPPGYRAALSALLAAGAAVLLCTFALRYPVDAQGDVYTPESRTADFAVTAALAASAHPDDDPADVAASIEDWAPEGSREPVAQALWPFSLAIGLPLLGAGLGFQAVRKRSSSKVVNRALYATLFGAVLTQGLLLLFLPVVIAMGVAMYQVRKAEAMAMAADASLAGAGAPDTSVIDVDEVLDTDAGDDDDADLEPDAADEPDTTGEPDDSTGEDRAEPDDLRR